MACCTMGCAGAPRDSPVPWCLRVAWCAKRRGQCGDICVREPPSRGNAMRLSENLAVRMAGPPATGTNICK
eukprot:12439873-Alexandrium_andersonii.AAC.1